MSKRKKAFLPVDRSVVGTYETLIDLPRRYYTGIGKVIQGHAVLETRVAECMYDLMKIDYPEGRLAFKYRGANTQFDLVIDLLLLRGLETTIDLIGLKDQIKECCDARDALAHNVWVEQKGRPAIRLTSDHFTTPEGKRLRAITPEGRFIPDGYFESVREAALGAAAEVQKLQKEIKTALLP